MGLVKELNIAVFLLAFGCCTGSGAIITFATVLFALDYFISHEKVDLEIWRFDVVKNTIIVSGVCLLLFLLASLLAEKNQGVKEIGIYLEKMVPFFLIIFSASSNKNVLKSAWVGQCIGTICYCLYECHYFFEFNARPRGYMGGPNDLGGFLTLIIPVLFLGSYVNKKIIFFWAWVFLQLC